MTALLRDESHYWVGSAERDQNHMATFVMAITTNVFTFSN